MTYQSPTYPNHFLSVYKHDYVEKHIGKQIKAYYLNSTQEFKDPIRQSFKNYLHIDEGNLKEPDENVSDFFEKFKENHPKITQAHFQDPLDEGFIKRNFIKRGKSVYQVDYCDLEKDREFNEELKRRSAAVTLPDDWEVPWTTYRASYKDTTKMDLKHANTGEQFRPIDNLGSKEHIFKILKVKTGRSEYQDVIGELGGITVNEELHGKIVHPKCTCLEHNLRVKYN